MSETTTTQVYIWRNRNRGVLIVTAKSIDDAREKVRSDHQNWVNWTDHHEPHEMPARVGNSLYIRQRET